MDLLERKPQELYDLTTIVQRERKLLILIYKLGTQQISMHPMLNEFLKDTKSNPIAVCFDYLLLKTINEVLVSIFGTDGARNIWLFLKEKCNLEFDEVPERIGDFERGLSELVDINSMIIEDLIIDTLYSKFDVKKKRKPNYKFTDYVTELRVKCEDADEGSKSVMILVLKPEKMPEEKDSQKPVSKRFSIFKGWQLEKAIILLR